MLLWPKIFNQTHPHGIKKQRRIFSIFIAEQEKEAHGGESKHEKTGEPNKFIILVGFFL